MRLQQVTAWALSLPTAFAAPESGLSSVGRFREAQERPTGPIVEPVWSVEDVTATNTHAHTSNYAEFKVPVGDGEYLFSALVNERKSQSGECGNLQVVFPPSTVTWTGSSDPVTLEVSDPRHGRSHSLELTLEPYCVPDVDDLDLDHIEAVKGSILAIDGKLQQEHIVFYIEWNKDEHYITDVIGGEQFFIDIAGVTTSPLLLHDSILSNENKLRKVPAFRDEDSDSSLSLNETDAQPAHPDEQDSDRVHEALLALEAEEKDLQALRERITNQRKLIDHLTDGKYSLDRAILQDCDDWACVIKKLFVKGKICVHSIFLRFSTLVKPSKPEHCSTMATAFAKTQVKFGITPSSNACSEKSRPDTKEYTVLSTSKEISSSDSDYDSEDDLLSDAAHTNQTRASTDPSRPSLSQIPIKQSYTTTHKINAALAFVLSLLCLSCLTAFLHRRCCNPRARADRAARREERRNQREYRRLARRQAWKDWWAHSIGLGCCLSCGGRKEARSGNYEEKRALIMQQEERLEGYMQEEIRYLTSPAEEAGRVPLPASSRRSMYEAPDRRRHHHHRGTRQSRANTGGSMSSNPDSLPSYRSRDSSRPPSYRTRASSNAQPAPPDMDENLVARMAEGFPHVRSEHRGHDWARDDDESPDSSVIDVSPRLSSETLRTERSAV